MAPFWDPYCPPLGITSLQAHLKAQGHSTQIFDYNTDRLLWPLYRSWFEGLVELIPEASGWNIMRLGPDYFARHQMAWLSLRDHPERLTTISQHILNVDGRHTLAPGDVDRLSALFERIYARIDFLTDELLTRYRPRVVGCTMLTTTLPASIHVLQRAKAFDPDCRTVLGGPGPIMGAGADSPDTQRILEQCGWIDNVVIGEGELLMEALLANAVPRRTLVSLRDVNTVKLDEDREQTTKQGLIRDLGGLPTPDYTGLEPDWYTNLSIGVTRGCAFRCSFCYETTYWKRYRKRPIQTAIRDLKVLSERHGRSHFFLCDSLANLFADDLATGLLEEGLDVKWDAYMRADKELLDPAYVRHLAEGGMVRARLGLESADEETLEQMDKSMSVDRMGTVLENLARAGIQTSTLWIVGFPEEDERAFQESLRFLVEYKDVIYCSDPWQFIFHPTVGPEPVFGRRVAAESFEARYGMRRLYPEEFDDALLVQYYELDIPDVVTMKIDRLQRMCAVMETAGIPNPYTMREWRAANRRWTEIHRHHALRA
jgi:pyruvate-formate lyase-activating enzyme